MKNDEPILTIEQIEDLRTTAKNMYGAKRRAFQAEIALKYCHGSPRKAEKIFGWGRRTVKVGLAELKSGVICVGAQQAFCGSKIWENRYPKIANELKQVVEIQKKLGTRLTSKEVLSKLSKRVSSQYLPSISTMDNILVRMGYRIRRIKKSRRKPSIPTESSIEAPVTELSVN